MFSPGCGLEIDAEIAKRVRAAQRRVRICSLLINSGTLIAALLELVQGRTRDSRRHLRSHANGGRLPAMAGSAVESLEDSVRCRRSIARAGIVGKNSTPYTPTSRHDFMHNKILVIDDTVITGSYNFSRSAQFNAENILFIESAALAERYSVYIDHLMQKYRRPMQSMKIRFRLFVFAGCCVRRCAWRANRYRRPPDDKRFARALSAFPSTERRDHSMPSRMSPALKSVTPL